MQGVELGEVQAEPFDALAGLVRSIGRDGFIHELLRSSRAFAAVEFVSLFAFPSKDRPVLLGTEGRPGSGYAGIAAEHYVSRHYRDDPNVAMMFDHGPIGAICVTYLHRDDVPTASYRTWCYDRALIADRLSLVSSTDQGVPFSVSFYGGRRSGVLREQERLRLQDAFPCIQAAALRHIELSDARSLDLAGLLGRVQDRFPKLSPRGAEVTAGVVAGLTAEQIGVWLGIASTSVITHRKRAYEQLGVQNQRGLLHQFYSN